MKEAVRKDIKISDSPQVLWYYAAEWRAAIISLTAIDIFQLRGRNPHTATFGEEGDISHLCQFAWCEWVYYYDDSSKGQFPFSKARIGRVLGPAKNKGNEMKQWILKQNGEVLPRRTLHKLTKEQLAPSNDVEKSKRDDFDADIRQKLGDTFSLPVDGLKP